MDVGHHAVDYRRRRIAIISYRIGEMIGLNREQQEVYPRGQLRQ